MKVALFAAGLFGAAFLIHWLVWHVRLPRRQTLVLLILFLSALPASLLLGNCVPSWSAYWPAGVWEWLHVATFHVALALAYIVIYSALEENSPSLTIVAFVLEGGDKGRSLEEVRSVINNDLILQSRLQAMVRDGLAANHDGVLRLTAKGRVWATVFSRSRAVLSMQKGG